MKETYTKIFSLAIIAVFVLGLIPALPAQAQGLVEIAVDRADLTYPLGGYMKITVTAPEWDTNSSQPDVTTQYVVFKNVSDGSVIATFLLEFTETGNATGIFEISNVSYDGGTTWENITYIELINANVTSTGYFEVYLALADGTRISNNVIFEVVAPAPTVTIVEPVTMRDELTIQVTDPGVNKASWVEDTTPTSIEVYINGTLVATLDATETGEDTDVFEVTTEMYFDILPQPLPGNFNITVVYTGAFGSDTAMTWLTWHEADVITDKNQTSPYATVVLTVYDPDLNDEATAIDYVTVNIPAPGGFSGYPVLFEGGKKVAEFYLLDQDGNMIYPKTDLILVGLETGADTGYFEISIDLSQFNIPSDVTALQFVWTDLTWGTAVNYTVVVEVPPVALSADRTVIPIGTVGNVYTKLNIIDAVLLNAADTLGYLTIEVKDYLGNVVFSYPDNSTIVIVDSTSGEDGEWVVTFHIDPAYYTPQLIGGEVHVVYKSEEVTIPFGIFDASVSVSTSEAKYGDEITVTVTDPDRNFWMDEYDTFTMWGLTFNETAPDSGIFTATFTLDRDWGTPGTIITFSLTDDTSAATSRYAASFSSSTTSVSVTILSFAGTLSTDKSEYLPVDSVTVTVDDADKNFWPAANDTVDVYIKTIGMVEAKPITLNETDENTGVFEKTMTVEELAKALLGPDATVDDLIGETVLFIYRDEFSPSGLISVSTTIKIVTVDGIVYFDKDLYKFDEGAIITVEDPDQAGKGSIDVRVWSDSDPVGTVITLVEVDDGVFQGEVGVVNVFTGLGGQVYANYGDTIYVAYEDPWSATGEPKVFTATAVVEAIPEFPISVTPEDVSFVDVSGAPITELTAGAPMAFQIPIENTGPTTVSFVVFIVITDEAGTPVYVSFTSGTVAPYSTVLAGPGWTPTEPGTYTVKILVWKSLEEPEPLLETAVELTVTVS